MSELKHLDESTAAATIARTTARDPIITRFSKWSRFATWGVASAGVGVVLWQAALWLGVLPARYFPHIWELAAAWAGLFGDRTFWVALGQTLAGALAGLVLGILTAVPVGLLIGRNVYLFHASRFILEFFRPIPSVALIPLIVLMLGAQTEAKVVLVFIAAFFPLLVQTTYGARDVDPVAFDTAKTYRIGPGRRVFQVLLPAASPYIMTGVRISASIALLVAVSTEIIVGSPGLGQQIIFAENANLPDQMYALIAMSGFLGMVINVVVARIERGLTGWARVGKEG